MKRHLLIATIFLAVILLNYNINVLHAQAVTVKATGEYSLPENMDEPFSTAIERARTEAKRNAIEQIAVYVSSHSISKGYQLTTDEVEILAAQIIKVKKETSEKEMMKNGDIKFIVNIEATANPDELDLPQILKQKHELEQSVKIHAKLTKLYNEQKSLNDNLKKMYNERINSPNNEELLQNIHEQKQMNDKKFLKWNNLVNKWGKSRELMRQEKYDDAILLLKELAAQDDYDISFHELIGGCYILPVTKKIDELAKIPTPPDMAARKNLLALLPRLEEAIKYGKKSLQSTHNNDEANTLLGLAHTYKGMIYSFDSQLENAIEELNIALDFIPHSQESIIKSVKGCLSGTYLHMADKCIQQNHVDEALSNIDNAIKNFPENFNPLLLSKIFIYQGDIYLSNHKYKQAVTCYDKALSINPDNTQVRDKRNWVYQRI